MRTTIDGAGRIVVPKALRDQAGFVAGATIEISFRDGRLEMERAMSSKRLEYEDGQPVVRARDPMPTLTTEEVREVIERIRR